MVPLAPLLATGIGAGVVGTAVWLYRSGKLSKLLKGSSASNANVSPSAPSSPDAPKPAVPSVPAAPTPAVAEQVQQSGAAVLPAKALYTYLKSNGVEPETDALKKLVSTFQKAHNSDNKAKGIAGQLAEDGLYGPGTSAALTVYTNDPIPGNPKYQPRTATLGEVVTSKVIGENGSNAGVAYQSQYNLIQYLKKNGHNDSAAERALVKQFQLDVNTDPLFPGPAYLPSPKPPVVHPAMSVDGILGPKSKGVLLFGSNDDDFALLAKTLKSIKVDPGYLELLTKNNRPVNLL